MRRRSLRLGITTLLSATLLGGATPAVAYEMQRDSATSLRIILDSGEKIEQDNACLLYTSPSPRDRTRSRMPSSA